MLAFLTESRVLGTYVIIMPRNYSENEYYIRFQQASVDVYRSYEYIKGMINPVTEKGLTYQILESHSEQFNEYKQQIDDLIWIA